MATLPVANAILDTKHANGQRYLYVFFSSTPFKTGRFIRFLTNTRYNHVSVSVDPELKELYSFARYYRNTPFYAGFVRESGTRFLCGGEVSNVKICALPITEEQYLYAKSVLADMRETAPNYIYNFLSAIVYPLHMRVRLPNAYTCVEFAVDFLIKVAAHPLPDPLHNYSISEFEALLSDYTVYSGMSPLSVEGDLFERHQNFANATILTVKANIQLLKSFLKYKLFLKT